MSERSKNQQFTPASVQALSREYRQLSHDEYQYYTELGAAMTLKNFWTRLQGTDGRDSQIVEAGAIPTAALLDLDNTTSLQLLALGHTFEDRLDKFWKSVVSEKKQFHVEKILSWNLAEVFLFPFNSNLISQLVISHHWFHGVQVSSNKISFERKDHGSILANL